MPSMSELAGYQGLQHQIATRQKLDELLHRMARARDSSPRKPKLFIRLRNRVVACHVRFALTVAQRYKNRGLPSPDLVQQAALGLMRAADTFEPSRGFNFTTFAAHWARHFVERAIANDASTVRVPVHAAEARRQVHAAVSRFETR